MNHSYKLHKKLYILLKQTGTHEMRHDLVEGYTNGRTTNSAEMSTKEILSLIDDLQEKEKDERSKMVRKVYYLARMNGYTKFDSEQNKDVVNNEELNGWLVKYSYLHKPLHQYSTSELPKLLTQFEQMVNKNLQKI